MSEQQIPDRQPPAEHVRHQEQAAARQLADELKKSVRVPERPTDDA